jgi:hypothetical protein
MPFLPEGLALSELVETDGVPREATADDGSQHMLFRDGHLIRSCLLADWPAEQAALAAKEAQRTKRAATQATLRAALTPIAGKKPQQWSVAELRDLVAVLLDQAGMLDADGAVNDGARP